ncbi:MAG: DUF3301 domain-containing protein [Methylophilaceae bacterium]|nr:DUF3301 domain-containing protein [Methylophilaceae bacterium]
MEILLLLFLVIAAWLWLDSISTRETAVTNGSDLAKRCNLQLLDETVACSKLRIGRNTRGRVQLLRTYHFEVSANGSDRLSCHLVLLGKQLQSWHIPAYQEVFN